MSFSDQVNNLCWVCVRACKRRTFNPEGRDLGRVGTYMTMRSQENQFLTNKDIFRPQLVRNILFPLKFREACKNTPPGLQDLLQQVFLGRAQLHQSTFRLGGTQPATMWVSTTVKSNRTRGTVYLVECGQSQCRSLTFQPPQAQRLRTLKFNRLDYRKQFIQSGLAPIGTQQWLERNSEVQNPTAG